VRSHQFGVSARHVSAPVADTVAESAGKLPWLWCFVGDMVLACGPRVHNDAMLAFSVISSILVLSFSRGCIASGLVRTRQFGSIPHEGEPSALTIPAIFRGRQNAKFHLARRMIVSPG
jgi:hypothetical protein